VTLTIKAEVNVQADNHLAPDAPLLWLRDKLHAGTTLEERVRNLRWKRKRPTKAEGFVNDACEQLTNNDEKGQADD
jgi:hypothetical protein